MIGSGLVYEMEMDIVEAAAKRKLARELLKMRNCDSGWVLEEE